MLETCFQYTIKSNPSHHPWPKPTSVKKWPLVSPHDLRAPQRCYWIPLFVRGNVWGMRQRGFFWKCREIILIEGSILSTTLILLMHPWLKAHAYPSWVYLSTAHFSLRRWTLSGKYGNYCWYNTGIWRFWWTLASNKEWGCILGHGCYRFLCSIAL